MMLSVALRDRTYRARSTKPIDVPSATAIKERPPKYKNWTVDSMKRAYSMVMDKELSISEASARFGIPYSTLCDRVRGRVKFGSHSGPKRYLNDSEEAELVNFLCGAASMGFARSKKEVLCIVEEVLATKGNSRNVSNGWWEAFCKRHPQLCLRTAEKLSYARLKATDPVILDAYFDLLERTLEEYDLFDSPSRIFNCDETGLCYQHKPPAVVAVRGQQHTRAVTTGNKRQVTVLACANAAGYYLPPLVILKRKTLPPAILREEVASTRYALSDTGWMDSDTFDDWFESHFLVHAPPARPLLLLLDGHSTHYNPKFIEKAAYERIVVFCLPPNTTHLCQPLDKGIFGPLKTYWNEEVHYFLRRHPGEVMNDFSFNQVFSRAWGRAMTIPNASGAFRTTGVYPFDRAVKAIESVKTLTAQSGLHYIPLLSPAPPRKSSRVTHGEQLDSTLGGSVSESDEANESPSNLLLGDIPVQQSIISRYFPDTQPELKPPRTYEKTSARILTSAEVRKELKEKEKKKREKQLEQQKKKEEREAKKQLKMEQAAAKAKKKAAAATLSVKGILGCAFCVHVVQSDSQCTF